MQDKASGPVTVTVLPEISVASIRSGVCRGLALEEVSCILLNLYRVIVY